MEPTDTHLSDANGEQHRGDCVVDQEVHARTDAERLQLVHEPHVLVQLRDANELVEMNERRDVGNIGEDAVGRDEEAARLQLQAKNELLQRDHETAVRVM
jgi:hypothetical protein